VATFSDLRQSLERIAVGSSPAPAPIALTTGYTGDFDPTIAPRGDRIVFSSARAGARTIWTSHLDGTAARPLTAGSALDQWPSLSPDGRNVAFVSDRGGKRGIWIVAADGGTPRKLVEASSLGGLTWSHDGARIAYAADAGEWPGLWTVRVADARVERLPTPDIATDPSWSPAGDVIAYLSPLSPGGTTGSPLVRLAFVDGTGRPRYAGLPGNPDIPGGLGNGLIAWSPDGRRVAVANQNTNTAASLWLIEPETPNATFRKLAQLAPGPRIRGMAWTPDGSTLIIGKHDWTSDIVLMELAR
jgi:Tol biopolymer transport system component